MIVYSRKIFVTNDFFTFDLDVLTFQPYLVIPPTVTCVQGHVSNKFDLSNLEELLDTGQRDTHLPIFRLQCIHYSQ